MAITFQSETHTTGNASSFTFSHTPTGNNRMLLVNVSSKGSLYPLVSSVTFNTTENLVQCSGALYGSVMVGEVWCLPNPTATTANVVVTLNGSQKAVCGATTYAGVDSVNLSNIQINTGQDLNPSGTITTQNTGSIIVQALAVRDRKTVITNDVNYTQRYADFSTGNPAGNTSWGLGLDRGVSAGLAIGSYPSSYTIDTVEGWVLIDSELIPAASAVLSRTQAFIF